MIWHDRTQYEAPETEVMDVDLETGMLEDSISGTPSSKSGYGDAIEAEWE